MGNIFATRTASRTLAAVHIGFFWLLTVATQAALAAPSAVTVTGTATLGTDSLWAVAYCVEFCEAGLVRLVYAGYVCPVTVGKPIDTRIATSPTPEFTNPQTAANQGKDTGIPTHKDTRTRTGWPEGITITTAEFTAALRRGDGPSPSPLPSQAEGWAEGTVVLLLAQTPAGHPDPAAANGPPSSLLLVEPLAALLDPEGTGWRRRLVADLLQRVTVPEVAHSSGPPSSVPPTPDTEPSAGPGE